LRLKIDALLLRFSWKGRKKQSIAVRVWVLPFVVSGLKGGAEMMKNKNGGCKGFIYQHPAREKGWQW
jgi:hypothetical protein